MDALHRARRYRLAGDFDSARQAMREVLTIEGVPRNRATAQGPLKGPTDRPCRRA
ncbi:DUF2379 family protein [Corallococcus macrosporus]|uniref:DUF2379 family protein n=1 Tax=Corallococcus macrosporus TaxID=35 RepID=UPI0009E44D4D|nr:DUF2379 family protein [Corallococcus macrosporus]